METMEINNRDLNGDEDKDNIDNCSVAPTLCHGRRLTMETMEREKREKVGC